MNSKDVDKLLSLVKRCADDLQVRGLIHLPVPNWILDFLYTYKVLYVKTIAPIWSQRFEKN